MTRLWALSCVLIAFLLPAHTQALDIKEMRTEHGLKVLLVENHTLPIITMSFAFRGGSTQDPENKPGTLNLMSALLDEGAGSYNAEDFQDRLEDIAARISFSASRDFFHGGLRTLKVNADDAFEMLRFAIHKPRFDEKPFNRIRDQILSGIRAAENNPASHASKVMRELIYPDGHPYRRSLRGTTTSIGTITPDDLRIIRDRIFARDNLIITIVGDITEEGVKTRIDKLFGDLPGQSDLKVVAHVDPLVGKTKEIIVNRPQTRFSLVGKGIDRQDPDFIPAYLVNQILGGSGLTSRLSNEVREKRGLAYGISTGLSNRVSSNLFTGSVATRADFADETRKVLMSELKRMADEGPTSEELDLAKSYTIGVYALNFDSSGGIARTLTSLQLNNQPVDYIKTRTDTINAVTLDQAKAAARRLLGEGAYTIVRLGPK